MSAASEDPRLASLSIKGAYAAIRAWYQADVDRCASDPQLRPHALASKGYVESLPPPEQATQAEIEDTLRRVLSGDLEWGYHKSDGHFKMAAYAHAGFESAGVRPFGG